MGQVISVLLLFLTCMYWVAALLVLLLRVVEPHVRDMARYGGRHVEAILVNNNNSSSERFDKKKYDSDNIWEEKTEPKGWLLKGVTRLVMSTLDEESLLCRVRVSRKSGFSAFYVTGIVSSLLLWNFYSDMTHETTAGDFPSDSSRHYESLPLVAFFFHCCVRLWECFYVHRFRGGPHDTVTLFAAVAGCSFYVFAAVSSSPILCWVTQTARRGENSSFGIFPIVTLVSFILHLLLQGVQGHHHGILAKLLETKPGSSSPEGSPGSEREQYMEGVNPSVEVSLDTARSSSYCFPYVSLFKKVLEPHYTCEILMYVSNAVSIWALILYSTSSASSLSSMAEVEGWELKGSCWTLFVFLSCVAPLGVLLFSLLNLAITASEHRRFWNELIKRRKGKEQRIPPWNLFYRIW